MRRAAAAIAFGVIGSWLVTAAITWRLDPGEWGETARAMTVLCAAPMLAIGLWILLDMDGERP